MAVQGDGRIVVGAEPQSGYGGGAVLVARYTAQGGPDPSFDGGAPLVTSLGSGLGGFGLGGTGRLVLAGPRCCGGLGQAVHVARLDESGRLDSEFGRQGQVFVDDVADGVGVGPSSSGPTGGSTSSARDAGTATPSCCGCCPAASSTSNSATAASPTFATVA